MQSQLRFVSSITIRQPMLITAVAFALAISWSQQASAQRLLGERLRKGNSESESTARRPNNQVEGRILEYKSTDYKSPTKPGEVPPELKGRIRIEGAKVYDASKHVTVKSQGERRGRLQKLRAEGGDVSIPGAGAGQKRIGEYRKLSDGKLRFDFDDPKSLNGILIAWPKKDSVGVLIGNYKKQDGKKTVGEWLFELRVIED